ncbi:MAG: hypothetical protein M0T76_10710 [Desulfobacteraceae bacterium]|nr:hypothetical protein [Desulfobacteraceae bacterium]
MGMEGLSTFLGLITRLLCSLAGVVLFFLFVVRPLLHYLLVNRQIEQQKRRAEREANAMLNEEPAAPASTGVAKSKGHGADLDSTTQPPERRPGNETRETLARLAGSSPDKAEELIKKWARSE